MKPPISGVVLTDLKIIPTEGGAVMHGLKRSEETYRGFGEAYFSRVNAGCIRGWKRHATMTSNLVVASGEMRFVLIDDRQSSTTRGNTMDLALSTKESYQRLTIPPGIWTAFQGLGEPTTLLLNLASIEHDPSEVQQLPIDHFSIHWYQ